MLEDEKEEKTGAKSNWSYLISLLRTQTTTKRDININVVDFLNGMKVHRVILLNYHKVKKSHSSQSTLPLVSHHSQNVIHEVPKIHDKKPDENRLKKAQSASSRRGKNKKYLIFFLIFYILFNKKGKRQGNKKDVKILLKQERIEINSKSI